ncbi:MAG: peptidylprolyl isomerase [Nitrospirae bacterium]|nr:peptidylprolyl isomerase [Nitrospirota bacterium]
MKKVLVFFFICAVFFVQNVQAAILLDKVMAIVNKEVITWSDLYRAMEFEATEAVKAMKDEERRRIFRESEMMFLEKLIDKRLVLQEAEALKIIVSEEEVNGAVKNIMDKYSMKEDAFKEAMKREGFTLAQYRKSLGEQITIGRLVDHDVRNKIVVSEAEVDKYFADNPNLAKESEGYDLSQIFIKKTNSNAQTEAKVKEIMAKIKEGSSFAAVAQQYSEDATARIGGSLGFIKKSELSPEFIKALATLKPGEMSDPFWGANGMHILLVNEVMSFKDQKELRNAVKQKLFEEKFNDQYKNWLKGLREKAYVEIRL